MRFDHTSTCPKCTADIEIEVEIEPADRSVGIMGAGVSDCDLTECPSCKHVFTEDEVEKYMNSGDAVEAWEDEERYGGPDSRDE